MDDLFRAVKQALINAGAAEHARRLGEDALLELIRMVAPWLWERVKDGFSVIYKIIEEWLRQRSWA